MPKHGRGVYPGPLTVPRSTLTTLWRERLSALELGPCATEQLLDDHSCCTAYAEPSLDQHTALDPHGLKERDFRKLSTRPGRVKTLSGAYKSTHAAILPTRS